MMTDEKVTSVCRICLETGATCSIFEGIKEENSIHSKLRECFKQKIEDIEGYPRDICFTCKDTLDIVYEFIHKFNESNKALKDGLVNLKCENDEEASDIESDHFQECEIEFENIKSEPKPFDFEDTEQFIEFLHPFNNDEGISEENRNKSIIVETKQNTRGNKYKNRTSKLASSILEGEFAWTGENWCLKSTLIKIPKNKEVKYKRRNTRLKLPKKPKINQPRLCDLCGDTFKTQYKLNVHRKKIHFSKPTKCTQCSRICSSQNNLLRHIKRRHGAKEFICATCGKEFAFKGELTVHVNKVHKNRPKKVFQCKFCDKTFTSQKGAVIHERSAHTGERPAECPICLKGFFHVEYLKEHMRLHTGETPFKCPVCGRGYAQLGNMKSHLRIHRVCEVDAATLSKMKPNYIKLLKI